MSGDAERNAKKDIKNPATTHRRERKLRQKTQKQGAGHGASVRAKLVAAHYLMRRGNTQQQPPKGTSRLPRQRPAHTVVDDITNRSA